MCRVAGVSLGTNTEKLDPSEIASILMPLMVNNGPDAFGWMTYNEKSEEIDHSKFVGRSDTDEAFEKIIYGVDPKAKWAVFHSRKATNGDPADLRNDHPLTHGQIIGVHNGKLLNHEAILSITGRDDPKTQVDSEAIFAAVDRWGPSKGLRRLEGPVVTIYANRGRPHVLHIARTNSRQLTIGFTKRGNLIFASEQWMLEKLRPEIRFHHFSTISENRLLLIRNGKIIQRYTFRKPEPRQRIFIPVAPQIKLPRKADNIPLYQPFDLNSFMKERQERRARKRGSLLFPKGMPKKVPNQNQKLYWHNNILMTRSEYEDAMRNPDLYPSED